MKSHFLIFGLNYATLKDRKHKIIMTLIGVDVFGGAGGVSSGWQASGIVQPSLTVERNPKLPGLSTAYELLHPINFPSGVFLNDTVQNWAVQGFPGILPDSVFMAHGSPPCQNFSQATRGKPNRQLENESDLTAAIAWADFITTIRPKYFTMEQVTSYQQSESFAAFMGRVRSLYTVNIESINLKHYGIPQDRRRLFVMGSLEGQKSLSLPPKKAQSGWLSTLSGLELKEKSLTQRQQTLADKIGCPTIMIPRTCNFDPTTARRHSSPYPTITRSMFVDGKNNGRSIVFNCLIDGVAYAVPFRAIARACGFFDDFRFSTLTSVAGSAIGNAFAPSFVADFIRHHFGV